MLFLLALEVCGIEKLAPVELVSALVLDKELVPLDERVYPTSSISINVVEIYGLTI